MTLIPYAGKTKRAFNDPSRALLMFENGKDTLDIAQRFGVSEATALRWVNSERSSLLGIQNPYPSEA